MYTIESKSMIIDNLDNENKNSLWHMAKLQSKANMYPNFLIKKIKIRNGLNLTKKIEARKSNLEKVRGIK